MSSLLPLSALVLLLGAGPAEKPADKPAEIAAYFHDGTVIHGAVVRDSIEITTRFGKLAVPLGEIRRIEFGHRVPADVADKIDDAIKRLGHEQFPQREAAGKELIALGKIAYPALQRAAQSSDKEVATRARAALEKLRETLADEALQFRADDVIYTRDCVLTGRIAGPALKAQTQKFGELSFKLADLRTVYSMATTSTESSVEAAPFAAAPDRWHDTGIEVEAGMGLVITASGKVDLVPQQPGQFVSGPEGNPNAGQNFGVLMGTLLGRIGEKGDIFVIGKRHEVKASRGGKLYVFIVPTQNGQAPTGSFKVKATAGFSLGVNPSKNPPTPPHLQQMWNNAATMRGMNYSIPSVSPAPGVIEIAPPAEAPPPPPAPPQAPGKPAPAEPR